MEVHLCQRVNDLRHSLFHLLNCLITTASKFFLELRELPKVTGSKVWTIGRVRNCFDATHGQIVCDKDGVVDRCIVLVETFFSRFSGTVSRILTVTIMFHRFLSSLVRSKYSFSFSPSFTFIL